MRQDDAAARQTDGMQISYVTQAGFLFDDFDFRAVFRSVRVNQNAVFAGLLRDGDKQFFGATDGETRRETIAQTPAFAPVPLFEQAQRFRH